MSRIFTLFFGLILIAPNSFGMSEAICKFVTEKVGSAANIGEAMSVATRLRAQLEDQEKAKVMDAIIAKFPVSNLTESDRATLARFFDDFTGRSQIPGNESTINPFAADPNLKAAPFLQGDNKWLLKTAVRLKALVGENMNLMSDMLYSDIGFEALAYMALEQDASMSDYKFNTFVDQHGGDSQILARYGMNRVDLKKAFQKVSADPELRKLIKETSVAYVKLLGRNPQIFYDYAYNPFVLSYVYAKWIDPTPPEAAQIEKALKFYAKMSGLQTSFEEFEKAASESMEDPQLRTEIRSLLNGSPVAAPASRGASSDRQNLFESYPRPSNPYDQFFQIVQSRLGPDARFIEIPEVTNALGLFIMGATSLASDEVRSLGGVVHDGGIAYFPQDTASKLGPKLAQMASDPKVREAYLNATTPFPERAFFSHQIEFRPQQIEAYRNFLLSAPPQPPGQRYNALEIGSQSGALVAAIGGNYQGNISAIPSKGFDAQMKNGNPELAAQGPYHSIVSVDHFNTSLNAAALAQIPKEKYLEWFKKNLAPGGVVILLNDAQGGVPFTVADVKAAGLTPVRWKVEQNLRQNEMDFISHDNPLSGKMYAYVIRNGDPDPAAYAPKIDNISGTDHSSTLAKFKDLQDPTKRAEAFAELVRRGKSDAQDLRSAAVPAFLSVRDTNTRFWMYKVFLQSKVDQHIVIEDSYLAYLAKAIPEPTYENLKKLYDNRANNFDAFSVMAYAKEFPNDPKIFSLLFEGLDSEDPRLVGRILFNLSLVKGDIPQATFEKISARLKRAVAERETNPKMLEEILIGFAALGPKGLPLIADIGNLFLAKPENSPLVRVQAFTAFLSLQGKPIGKSIGLDHDGSFIVFDKDQKVIDSYRISSVTNQKPQ